MAHAAKTCCGSVPLLGVAPMMTCALEYWSEEERRGVEVVLILVNA